MKPYRTAPATAIFLPRAVPAPPGFMLAERMPVDLPKLDPGTGQPLPLLPCPFHALLFGEGAAASVPDGALCLSGTQHIVKPGDGNILVVMLARRRPDMTHQAFLERWLQGHAPFGLRIAASGYRQLHSMSEPNPTGFDGAGLVYFHDIDHMASNRSAPEVARDATRDEMAFIDHSRSMLAMFRIR